MNRLVWLALPTLAKGRHPRRHTDAPSGGLLPDGFGVVIVVAVVALVVIFAASVIARLLRRGTRAGQTNRPEVLSLGAIVRSPNLGTGDLGWGSWANGAQLPTSALRCHVLIGGGTGEGKSTTIERIEFEAAARYAPQIVHFDCKGRRGGSARFLAIMQESGYDDRRVAFAPLEPFDGWRGDERPMSTVCSPFKTFRTRSRTTRLQRRTYCSRSSRTRDRGTRPS